MFHKHLAVLGLSLSALLIFACNKKADTMPAAVIEKPVKKVILKPFTPPEDGLLNPEKIREYSLAHQALIQVSQIYLDSLQLATPDQAKEILKELEIAKDKAVRKYGLNGYAEYEWILNEASKLPENAKLLADAKILVSP